MAADSRRDEDGPHHLRPNDGSTKARWSCKKETRISADDTLGSGYFDRLFPSGVKAMLEAPTSWWRANIAKPNRRGPGDYKAGVAPPKAKITGQTMSILSYNVIRGCNSRSRGWTTLNGRSAGSSTAAAGHSATFGA